MTNSTYQGSTHIVLGDFEIAVMAELHMEVSPGLAGWRGILEADDPNEDFNEVIRAEGNPTFRLADGRTGEFVPTNTSVGTGVLRITGSGPKPF
ncbi:hypothetical protein [Yinghuangia sp. YIM S09857]|uniref:hypothetical protein n=1 Tax=Yinghuangia sp. YIM S09857 TaxID=3436929 RepID=UPI003F52921B